MSCSSEREEWKVSWLWGCGYNWTRKGCGHSAGTIHVCLTMCPFNSLSLFRKLLLRHVYSDNVQEELLFPPLTRRIVHSKKGRKRERVTQSLLILRLHLSTILVE